MQLGVPHNQLSNGGRGVSTHLTNVKKEYIILKQRQTLERTMHMLMQLMPTIGKKKF
jgi:hypothetical protein